MYKNEQFIACFLLFFPVSPTSNKYLGAVPGLHESKKKDMAFTRADKEETTYAMDVKS